jgi:hypothetical protein
MATLFVDKLDPQSGTALEIGTSGDTITVPSGATFNVAGTLQSGGVGMLGIGQSWAEVSGSRAMGVTYTNSTGQPIMVVISLHLDDAEVAEFRIGGTAMGSVQKSGGNPARMMCSMIVPEGDTYGMFNTSGTTTVSNWAELS